MYNPICGLARDGLPIIGFFALAALITALLRWPWLAGLFLLLTFFSLNFFRDPDRTAPVEPGIAVAPADGVVCKMGEATDPASGETRQVVCIFMNVFNVHVNRMPVAGRIARISYFGGKFLNASFDKASTDNERNAVLVEDAEGKSWTMVQIAGLIARRIICWSEEGDSLKRGQRFGLIKFGSRVDLYLPDGYEPSVRIGDKVFAGQSILARKK